MTSYENLQNAINNEYEIGRVYQSQLISELSSVNDLIYHQLRLLNYSTENIDIIPNIDKSTLNEYKNTLETYYDRFLNIGNTLLSFNDRQDNMTNIHDMFVEINESDRKLTIEECTQIKNMYHCNNDN